MSDASHRGPSGAATAQGPDRSSGDHSPDVPPRRRLLSRDRDGGSLAFVAAMALANVGNFAFHLAASRQLGPAHYGALASALGILLALSLPTSSLQVALTRTVAALRPGGNDYSLLGVTKRSLALAVAAAVVLALAAPPLAAMLDLSGPGAVVWLAVFIPGAVFNTICRGTLLGQQKMMTLAGLTIVATTARVTGAMGLLQPGDTEIDALQITVAAEYLLAVMMGVTLAPNLRPAWRKVRLQARDLGASTMALTGLWLLLAADLAAARVVLTPAQSGVFAAAALGARAALFVPQAVANAAHAKLSTDVDADEGNRIVRVSMLATVGLCAINVAVMALLGPWIINTAFGTEFHPSRSLIVVLTLAASTLAVANLLVHLRLALGRSTAQVWLGVVVIAIAAAVLPPDPVLLGGASVVAATLVVLSLDSGLRVRRRAGHADGLVSRQGLDVTLITTVRADDPDAVAQSVAARSGLENRFSAETLLMVTSGSDAELASLAADATAGNGPVNVIDSRGTDTQRALGGRIGQAAGRNVVLFDAASGVDGADLVDMVLTRELFEADMVVGSRRHVMSQSDYPVHRRALLWLYQLVLSGLFRLRVRDAQMPAKVLSRSVAADVAPWCRSGGAGFEVELVIMATRFGHRRILEAPIRIRAGSQPPLRLSAAFALVTRTICLRFSLLRTPTDPTPAPPLRLETVGVACES